MEKNWEKLDLLPFTKTANHWDVLNMLSIVVLILISSAWSIIRGLASTSASGYIKQMLKTAAQHAWLIVACCDSEVSAE